MNIGGILLVNINRQHHNIKWHHRNRT